jgi:hypothetical protein
MASKHFSHSVQNLSSKIPTGKDVVNNKRRLSVNKKVLSNNPNKENDVTIKTIKMKSEVAIVIPQKTGVKIEGEPNNYKDHDKDIVDITIKTKKEEKQEKKVDVAVAIPAIPQKTIINIEDEPLLKPNPRRFVLFPIQFHEVCI